MVVYIKRWGVVVVVHICVDGWVRSSWLSRSGVVNEKREGGGIFFVAFSRMNPNE